MASIQSYDSRTNKPPEGKIDRKYVRYRVRYRAAGKQKSKTFTLAKDAETFRRDVESREQLGHLHADRAQTFGEFAGLEVRDDRVELTGEGWFERYRETVRDTSFTRRRDTRKHLRPFLTMTFEQISVGMVDDHIKALQAQRPRQAKYTLETIRMIFRSAAQWNQPIDRRILTDLNAPKQAKSRASYMTPEQLAKFEEASDDPSLVRFMANTGLRPGEVLALQRHNCHDTHIRVVDTAYDGELKGRVKTEAGERTIPLNTDARAALRTQLAKHENTLVWPGPLGGVMRDDLLRQRFRAWLKKVRKSDPSFPKVTPHTMRHTFISLMARSEVSQKVTQELAGHESILVTSDIYTHIEDEQKVAAVAQMGDWMKQRRAV